MDKLNVNSLPRGKESAESMAQDVEGERIKKNIFKSMILISFILILEAVIYLARREFLP